MIFAARINCPPFASPPPPVTMKAAFAPSLWAVLTGGRTSPARDRQQTNQLVSSYHVIFILPLFWFCWSFLCLSYLHHLWIPQSCCFSSLGAVWREAFCPNWVILIYGDWLYSLQRPLGCFSTPATLNFLRYLVDLACVPILFLLQSIIIAFGVWSFINSNAFLSMPVLLLKGYPIYIFP